MNRQDWQKAYMPEGNGLEIRVKNTLSSLPDEAQRSMNMKKICALTLAAVLMITAAFAAGGLFSNEYDAVRLAKRALVQEYGITEEMQSFFGKTVQEKDGVTTIVYSGLPGMEHVLGAYTVEIEDGKVQVSWTHDGVSTEGGLDAHAWGAEQIGLLIQMVKETGGISGGYYKAHTLCNPAENGKVTLSVAESSATQVIAMDETEIRSAAISEDQAIAIAQKAFVQEFGLTQNQLDQMIYEKDYAGYTYANVNGVPICEVWFWLHQDEDAMHTDGDGLYWARVNATTGVIEAMEYDSALAGNG